MRQFSLYPVGLLAVLAFTMGCSMVTAVTPSTLPTTAPETAVALYTPGSLLPTETIIPLPTAISLSTLPTPSPVIALANPADTTSSPDMHTAVPTPTFTAYGITQTIGFSAQNRPIVAHRFGFGTRHLVLVGGIHGGYEWNTIVLAYELIDYFTQNPDRIPKNVTLTIIPAANLDGQFMAVGHEGEFTPSSVQRNMQDARFNGNMVDLNRNWDCDWQEVGFWGEREVNTGSMPFSEPETLTLRRFFLGQGADAVIFYHSKANGVFAGGCPDVYQPAFELATIYGEASNYPVFERFTYYPVTGDASDWLALQDIPSFSVELKTHTGIDWTANLAGVLALLDFYAMK
jgi:eukaryotic-like serine/threonine-protein kinase